MSLPVTNFKPQFNITRASHVVITAKDLGASCAFYTETIGLVLTERTNDVAYLRGLEEICHHSLVIRRAGAAVCERIGLRVMTPDDLDTAKAWFDRQGVRSAWADVPHQGRTLHLDDSVGTPLEFCAEMEVVPRQLQEYHTYRSGSPQRLDHYQIATHDVETATRFYTDLGFRITEYTASDDDALWGTWMQRKGNTHDIVFTNGRGPRLHHFAYTVNDVHDLIHACDTAGSTGFGDCIDRGPGRHGISNALFAYFRDPDQHRIELFTTHYQAIDMETPPLRWSVTNPRRSQLWGMPASRRWFFEATEFAGKPVHDPLLKADPVTLESVLCAQH